MKSAAIAAFLLACGASAPKELVDARAAYARASRGVAAELDPSDVHVAGRELAEAESSLRRVGDTAETRDLAYVARRRAEIAEARAREIAAHGVARDAESRLDRLDQDRVRLTSATIAPDAAFILPAFDEDRIDLSPATLAVLDRVGDALARAPRSIAIVELPPGPARVDRGESIRAYLETRGIPGERVVAREAPGAPRVIVEAPSK